jgi:transitional endoplasmic reticulum ATPase
MTECHKHGIFIIAATNRPEKIDPAIMRTGRIDRVIYLGPPDYDARHKMFEMYLEGRPVDPAIDFKIISEMTDNYVSSDIKFIINEASRNALKERTNISQQHIEKVIIETNPSVSISQIKKYEEFKNNRSFV